MAGRRAARPAPRRSGGGLRAALTTGDRPYLLALLLLVGLIAGMAIGPLQLFTAAADRVDGLEAERDALMQEVERLEDRTRDLEDPEEVELLARAELGLVKPGEVPYIVVTPETDPVLPVAPEVEVEPDDAWHRRLGRWFGELFGAGG